MVYIIFITVLITTVATSIIVFNIENKKRISKFTPNLSDVKILYVEKDFCIARIPNKEDV